MFDIFFCEEFCEFGFKCLEFAEIANVRESIASTAPSSALARIRTSIMRMVPLSTSVRSSLAISPVKLLAPDRELDDDVVDRAQLLEGCIGHLISFR